MVFLEGELWRAEIVDGAANEGEEVSILEVNGLQLKVSKLEKTDGTTN